MLFSPSTLSSVNTCLGWNRGTDNPQAPLREARTGPVLLVNARHDPATPYAWARNVAAQLGPRASLLTYEGWGHVAYGRSDCVSAAVDRYLLEPWREPGEASCPGAADYRRTVRERQEAEARTLASLTGWDLADIRRKIRDPWPGSKGPEAAPSPSPWWRRIWE